LTDSNDELILNLNYFYLVKFFENGFLFYSLKKMDKNEKAIPTFFYLQHF
jgi:hypothetical protein